MELFIYITLAIFGAALGSFCGATVWRLRAAQVKSDKKSGEKITEKELKRLNGLSGRKLLKDRSECLECHEPLKWYDMIPVLSWFALRGKCRYCRKPIGYTEILLELGLAGFFVASYALWPFELDSGLSIARFVIWLAAGVVLAVQFVYDLKWFLLPDRASLILAVLGLATAIIVVIESAQPLAAIFGVLASVGVLSGLYLLLYVASKGSWVGFGDVKLGVGLGLLLSDWQLALIALFLANFIGCLIVIPLLIVKKLKRSSRVPFGPLLIIGMILAQLVGSPFVAMYLNSVL